MSQKSSIEWTDATWTPIRARVKSDAAEIARAKGYTSLVQIAAKMAGRVGPHCEMVSEECTHCYSQTNNSRCLPSNGTGLPFDRRARDLVDPVIDEKILLQPMKWRAPRIIFVCSQTDLFGEWVPDEMIWRTFGVMRLANWHKYIVLTKRAKRMHDLFAQYRGRNHCHEVLDIGMGHVRSASWIDPLENVVLAVSAGNQSAADERIPELLRTPAICRMVSYEPALGPLRLWKLGSLDYHNNTIGYETYPLAGLQAMPDCDWEHAKIDWVIVGGESGPGARQFHVKWVEDIIEQCGKDKVACFVKQLGAYPVWAHAKSSPIEPGLGKNGDPSRWPESLRVREFPEVLR